MDKIRIKSGKNRDKIWIKGHGRGLRVMSSSPIYSNTCHGWGFCKWYKQLVFCVAFLLNRKAILFISIVLLSIHKVDIFCFKYKYISTLLIRNKCNNDKWWFSDKIVINALDLKSVLKLNFDHSSSSSSYTRNRSIYNVLHWVVWTMGQTNYWLSIWCSKYYFHDFVQKSFQFISISIFFFIKLHK